MVCGSVTALLRVVWGLLGCCILGAANTAGLWNAAVTLLGCWVLGTARGCWMLIYMLRRVLDNWVLGAADAAGLL